MPALSKLTPPNRVAALIALGLVYYLTAQVGFTLGSTGAVGTLVWPPTGVAIGALVRLGIGAWPGVALGAALVIGWDTTPVPVGLALLTGNVAGPVLAVAALAQLGFDRRLRNARDALAFAGASTVGLFVTAGTGAVAHLLHDGLTVEAATGVLGRWWLGDVIGALIVGPAVITFDRESLTIIARRRLAEFMAMMLVSVATGQGVFLLNPGMPLTFLILPVLAWGALRFPGLGASVVLLTLATFAVWGTGHGSGPFSGHDRLTDLLLLSAFLAVLALLHLILAALLGVLAQAREAARSNEARLQLAIASGAMGTWDWDLATGNLDWNDGHKRLFGISAEEFDGRYETVSRRVHPEDLPVVNAAIEHARTTGAPYQADFRVIWPDGSVHWLAGRGEFVRNELGTPVRMMGVLQDVSARREALAAIQHTSDRLRVAMKVARMGAWELDAVTGRPVLDADTLDILGRAGHPPPTDLEACLAMVHGEDVGAIRVKLAQSLAQGSPFQVECRIVLPDGGCRWIAAYAEVEQEGGKAVLVVGVVQDISDRKQAEREVLANQSRLEGIVNSAMDSIITVDEDQRIVVFNTAAERTFGLPAAEAIGQPVGRFIPARLRERHHDHVERFAEGSPALRPMGQTHTTTGVRADGREFPIEASISQVEVDGRRLQTVTLRDVTEQRQAAELQQRLEEQLRQSQKLEAVGTLAGGIAHDFNNILGAILGNVELARLDLPETHGAREALTQITTATLRARDMVKGLLAFTRQRESSREALRMQTVVEEVLGLLRASLPSSIEILPRLDRTAPPVLADVSELHQVIMNLCTNAFQAMQPQGGTLEIELDHVEVDEALAASHPDLRPDWYVRLGVADTGVGMDPPTLGRIFEPFFTTKPVGEGTGLGLSVVHGIVKAHNGAITVESQRGRGSRFRIYLPALKERVDERRNSGPALLRGNGEHILFVDDEPALVSLGRRALQRLNYRVTGTTQPEEALAMLRANPAEFDLVITDLTMPDLTGTDLAAEIQQVRSDLPVILATGYGGAIGTAPPGIRAVIHKPATLEQLATEVHRVLRADPLDERGSTPH